MKEGGRRGPAWGQDVGVGGGAGRQFRVVSCLCPSPDPRPGPLLCTEDQGMDWRQEDHVEDPDIWESS